MFRKQTPLWILVLINLQPSFSLAFTIDLLKQHVRTHRTQHHNRPIKPSTIQKMKIDADPFSLPFKSSRRQLCFQRHMAPPKSGGRPISSIEEFQAQVLTVKPENDDPNNIDISKTISKPILVYFNAPWCGPCRLTLPIIKDIINQFKTMIEVVDVCTDDLPEIAESVDVVSIPTIQIYHQGELKDTIVGCVSTNVLASAVTKVLEDIGLKIEDK